MYPYGHDPSLSSALSRDAEMATTASQRTSTAPTSTQPPEHLMRPSLESAEPNHGMLFSSNTLPALAGRDSHKSRALPSSVTWTSSSGDLAMFSDTDEIQDRRSFIQEYNRLAKKHGIRVLVAKDFDDKGSSIPRVVSDRRRWWSRVFRSPSSGQDSKPQRSSGSLRHKRSVSDMALHLVHSRRPEPKAIDLQTMVRLCGKSFLYLPPEYCPGSLVLPTCFRATAQYLLQYGPDTRGVFRIPGSVRVVSTLFDYYCYEREGEEVTSTIRCPTLPSHINAGPHEVASTFKKLLSVLPGGILGSLSLFDALVAIHSQLRGEPELSRTKTTKLRARLIALAIGTVESQFRRELICAVFGLLSVIGRAAETAAREDDQGRPLPTSDLMGYTALGIVFGPLLMSELLDSYTMKLATPSSGLVLLPLTPTQLRREKIRKDNANSAPTSSPVDKIHVANDITEMLIANWREIVRNMKNLGILSRNGYLVENTDRRSFMRTSSSEGFTIGLPKGWKSKKSSPGVPFDREASPTPDTPTPKSSRYPRVCL
ncbi:RhoGAP domain-containing protein [Colletotrichum plurivorum]|uniref:RhoGAP domain-containing protein n=1 Tax=Colletotrichum plurivorum TaxID=2175906 RepID=A0A8H6NSK4_9PEZI|nr:RhoGAP domain-containing protein [Colletotrichum plurivorum]